MWTVHAHLVSMDLLLPSACSRFSLSDIASLWHQQQWPQWWQSPSSISSLAYFPEVQICLSLCFQLPLLQCQTQHQTQHFQNQTHPLSPRYMTSLSPNCPAYQLQVICNFSSSYKPHICFFFLFFFFSFIFINWRLITSQHCSGFCHTLTWISHGVTCIPHPHPPPSPPDSSGSSQCTRPKHLSHASHLVYKPHI